MWELETINALGWSEDDWLSLPVKERGRKVVAHKLASWLQVLETELEIAKIKRK